MKVLTYSVSKEEFIGLQVDGKLINFSFAWDAYNYLKEEKTRFQFKSIAEMIEIGIFSGSIFKEVCRFLKDHALLDRFVEKEDIKFEAPIRRPAKILALARNYRDHAKELGNEPVEEPIIFSKTTNTILPHQGNIIYPEKLTRVDHEIELGVIIGKETKSVNVENAQDCIAGYTIVNDVTARDLQKNDLSNELPWLRSKNFDTFLPIGPYIVPVEFVKDPENMELTLTVNGEERQRGNSSLMINSVPQIISYISGFMTLSPGDIICTGTPAGVSQLKVGDVVEATIEGIGTLVNTVISEV
ncbi:MAG: fumarylacetoacetate hydrolase family protein [Candidatus Anammoxibacter sp.]